MDFKFDGVKFAVRFALAACLAFTAIEHVVLTSSAYYTLAAETTFRAVIGIAMATLLGTIATYLVLGIRTRVVATLGLILFVAMVLILPGLHQFDVNAAQRIVVVLLLSAPLIIRGGGRFSLVQGGWHGAL